MLFMQRTDENPPIWGPNNALHRALVRRHHVHIEAARGATTAAASRPMKLAPMTSARAARPWAAATMGAPKSANERNV